MREPGTQDQTPLLAPASIEAVGTPAGLVRSAVLLRAGADAFTRIISLLALTIITRSSGAESYGTWALVTAIAYFSIPLTTLSLGNALVHAHETTERPEVTAARLRKVSGLVGAILIALGALVAALEGIGAFAGTPVERLLLPCMALTAAVALEQLVVDHLRARSEYLRYNGIQILIGVVTLAPLIVVPPLTSDVAILLGVLGIARLSIALTMILVLGRGLRTSNPVRLKPLVAFSMPIVIASFGAWGMYMTSRVTIAASKGSRSLAVFSAAIAAAGLLSLVSNALGLPAYPRMVAAFRDGGIQALASELQLFRRWTGYALIPTAVILGILLPTALDVLAGNVRLPLSTTSSCLLVAGVSLEQWNVPVHFTLLAAGRSRFLRNVWLVAGTVNAVACVVLVPLFGLNGAGISLIVAMLVMVCASDRAVTRLLAPHPYQPHFSSARTVAAGVAGGITILVLQKSEILGNAALLIAAPIASLAIVGAVLAASGEGRAFVDLFTRSSTATRK